MMAPVFSSLRLMGEICTLGLTLSLSDKDMGIYKILNETWTLPLRSSYPG